jgi:hypothetical protein
MNNQTTTTNQKYNIDETGINEILVRESLDIPQGFHEEIYFNMKTNELSFSSPMTSNSWTDSTDIVGIIEHFSYSDLEGWKTIDNDFVEVDDRLEETDDDFKDKDYERKYEDSSIISRYEALDRISLVAEEEGWFEDIINLLKGVNQ